MPTQKMDLFQEFSQSTKSLISARIRQVILNNRQLFDSVPFHRDWLIEEMIDFAISGKMLRGTLSLLGAHVVDLPGDAPMQRALSAAACLELLQAGLLVHDDIMDHDEKRRGKPTFHLRISHRMEAVEPRSDLKHLIEASEAQGICIGDLYFFIAWQEIASLPTEISSLIAREHAKVTLAQMQDVAMGYRKTYPSMQEVIDMYRRKTARYTVALPLRVGACLASQNFAKFHEIEGTRSPLMEELEAYGEALGIVFQLQDDRLGLFGDENSLGKSIGSDIREGKKTPYIISLLPKLSPKELQHFEEIFGLPNTSTEDMQWLCALILSRRTDLEIQEVVRAHISSARSALQSISALRYVSATAVHILEDFIEFSTERSK